jgi:hypothetical protein
LAESGLFLSRMFLPTSGLELAPLAACTVVAAVSCVLLGHVLGTFVDLRKVEARLPEFALGAGLATLFLLGLLLLPESGKAFIYFQF